MFTRWVVIIWTEVADPWRFGRSLSFEVELDWSDRSLHQTSSFGKPRVLPLCMKFAVASYDGQRSERNKNTKEKQPVPLLVIVQFPFSAFFC
jgi:hypothetical protein